MVALSTPVTIALIGGALISLAFVGVLIALRLRGRPAPPPDIPAVMKPGPADEILERRQLEKIMGWGVVMVLFFAAWIPLVWFQEPPTNVDDEIELISRSVERGEMWFQVSSTENPTGFGCARCHGAEGEGGTTPFTTPDGKFVPDYPVPALDDECGRLAIEGDGGMRETIEQGRPGTPMPSWSVEFAGPMNDQQIQDLINYIVSIQDPEKVPPDENKCLNPPTGTETAS